MEIKFSAHALFQMREREISQKEVEKIIKKPEKIFKRSKYRYIVQGKIKFDGRLFLLRVIYDKINEDKEIVTVYRTSKLRKYLNL
jgi:hypothetical protein